MGVGREGVEKWFLVDRSVDGLASKVWFRHGRLARSLVITC